MIGGFNAFIKEQRKIKGDCKVFFYQFDTEYDTVYEKVNLDNVNDLDDKTYVPRWGTALYPSLGKTIEDIGKKLSSMRDYERPERILFVTITDGIHNSNLSHINGKQLKWNEPFHQFTSDQVKSMIEHQTQVYNWDFAYIGANQDTWAVGSGMGHTKGTTLSYVASATGTSNMWDKLCGSTATYRSSTTKKKFTFEEEETKTKS